MTIKSNKTESAGNRTPQTENALKELFLDEMKDMYWSEQHLMNTLPKLVKGVTSTDLKQAILNHLEQTKTHLTRLETAFQSLGERAAPVKCLAMECLLKEMETVLSETGEETEVLDIAIITVAQKMEHYEIASYGALKTIAAALGFTEIAELFGTTLEEEKMADWLLTEIENYENEAVMAE